MNNSTRILLGTALGIILVSNAALAQPAPAAGRGGAAAAASTQAGPPPVSEEYLLLGDATRGSGEPMIAVSPVDPKTIVVVGMGNLLQLERQTPRSTITWLAVTHNGGISWKIGELPMLDDKLVRCPDSMMDVTKDGIFIGGCEPRDVGPGATGKSAIVISRDKGETWGPVVDIISSFAPGPARFAPGLKPLIRGASPWDRPFTYIDDSTGVIYGQAAGGQTDIDTTPGTFRTQAYITASTDGGKSFGTIYSWDSKEYPGISRGFSMTAGHGEAAVIYIARAVPAKENATCPCAVMGITKDLGKTFDYHVLKNFSPVAGETPAGSDNADVRLIASGGLTAISSDFTKKGRYAILKYTKENGAPLFSVAVSEDHGKIWSPFVAAGKTPGATQFARLVSFQYGRNGILALMWRAVYADGSYDIWSSISKDFGRTFSDSLRVSHAKSPGTDYYRSAWQNDDVQDFSMDNENIHMVWADNRAGFLGTWYGRVALSSYKFTTP